METDKIEAAYNLNCELKKLKHQIVDIDLSLRFARKGVKYAICKEYDPLDLGAPLQTHKMYHKWESVHIMDQECITEALESFKETIQKRIYSIKERMEAL